MLQALADSTAVALENARTLERIEALVAERAADLSASNRDLAAFAHVAATTSRRRSPPSSVAPRSSASTRRSGPTPRPPTAWPP